jgi:hypothetical protein
VTTQVYADVQNLSMVLRKESHTVGVGDVVFSNDTNYPVAYPHLPPPPPGTKRVVDRGVVLERRGGQWYGLPIKWDDVRPSRIAFAIRMLPWR